MVSTQSLSGGLQQVDHRYSSEAPDNLLQVPMGDNRVVVTVGQHFSLFRQPQYPWKVPRGQRENAPGRRPTTTTQRTSAAVKEVKSTSCSEATAWSCCRWRGTATSKAER